jgi:hypothetical protein
VTAASVSALTVALSLAPVALLAGPAPGTAAPVTGCAWANQVGAGGVPGYDADLNAAYWVTSFLATPRTGIIIDGSFPRARYMSISAYNVAGPTSGVHLYDAQIQPATGANPFQTGVSTGATGTYELKILSEPAPPDAAPNTLYVGNNSQLVYVLYRVYDSDDPSDLTGGAGLPQLSITFDGIVTAIHSGCVGPASGNTSVVPEGSRAALRSILAAGVPPAESDPRPNDSSATPETPVTEPNWAVAAVTSLPNDDAGYLEAPTNQVPGQIVVIRVQTPTFPDTNAGGPPWEPAQVRYWSICQYGEITLAVAGCVADHDAIESGGVATIVISDPADQPTNATAANGINWLPWGNSSRGLVVYRQILADPSFAQSIVEVPAAVAPSTTMGPYYPQIAVCSVSEFESSGASGCLSAAGSGTSSATTPGGAAGSGSSGGSGTHARGKLSRAAITEVLSAEIVPTGRAARIAALLRKHGYTFQRYRLPESGSISLVWWYVHGAHHGRTSIANGTLSLRGKATGELHMHLTEAGTTLLRHQRHVALSGIANYTPTGQTAITLRRPFTLVEN